MVIRGYLSGHAAREYKAGKRTLCGVEMAENLKELIASARRIRNLSLPGRRNCVSPMGGALLAGADHVTHSIHPRPLP